MSKLNTLCDLHNKMIISLMPFSFISSSYQATYLSTSIYIGFSLLCVLYKTYTKPTYTSQSRLCIWSSHLTFSSNWTTITADGLRWRSLPSPHPTKKAASKDAALQKTKSLFGLKTPDRIHQRCPHALKTNCHQRNHQYP
ncbi:hypothetical protein SAMN05216311_10757 [Chitinophaga sp. CF418]|nr:hypothetical protein SAMN05216311_10757 [Chitinophaga sp. CF418]